MENLILEPLKFYEQVGKSSIENNAKAKFDELVKQSGIDVEANRRTAKEYREQATKANKTAKKIKGNKVFRVFMIIFAILGILAVAVGFFALEETAKAIVIIVGAVIAILCVLLIFIVINKNIKKLKKIYEEYKQKADTLFGIANGQMEYLNSLFSEDDTLELVQKSFPNLTLSRNYSLSDADYFAKNYDFKEVIDENSSVINTLSGKYNENPFIFARYLNHFIGEKTYYGSTVISWTEYDTDSNGRSRRIRRTQTLHASINRPFPYYKINTALLYGNQCAPDLSFSRQATDVEELSERQVERRVKKGAKKLKKKEEKAVSEGGSFTQMANTEFDVLFGALDRDHEVQFRTMFTPLAQVNMVELLCDKKQYGDDFVFTKKGKFNRIDSEHAQKWQMDTDPINYQSYDVDIAQNKFIDFNKEYYKSVFFDFAPLLSVPAYHEKPSMTIEPLSEYAVNYSSYDHEMVANAIGVGNFAHPASHTEVILKTKHIMKDEDTDCVEVTAKSYRGEDRLEIVPVFGGDGRMHGVPVPWVEYLPLENITMMAVKKVGLAKEKFDRKVKSGNVSIVLDGNAGAYVNGLFGKIINVKDIKPINEALDKIKNKEGE